MRSVKRTQSATAEQFWNSRLTGVLWALEDGVDPGELIEELTRRYGVPNARRMVDMASARLWLAEGVPADRVFTMLQARCYPELSPSERRAHAIEILLAVRQAITAEEGPLILHRKDTCNAVA